MIGTTTVTPSSSQFENTVFSQGELFLFLDFFFSVSIITDPLQGILVLHCR